MFKRLFFASVGLGAGVLIGSWAVRKLDRAQHAATPAGMSEAAARRAGDLGARWRAAVEVGREAAAHKEAELRAVYRGGETPDRPDT